MYQRKRQRVITENDQDDYEEIYEALSTKLQIVSDMSQIFQKDIDPNMQKMLEFSKNDLRKDIRLLMSRGVDFMALYKKFGSLLFKSQVLTAQDAVKKLTADKHENLVDLVNEDLRLRQRLEETNNVNIQQLRQNLRPSAFVIERPDALQQFIRRRLGGQIPGQQGPAQPPPPGGQPPGGQPPGGGPPRPGQGLAVFRPPIQQQMQMRPAPIQQQMQMRPAPIQQQQQVLRLQPPPMQQQPPINLLRQRPPPPTSPRERSQQRQNMFDLPDEFGSNQSMVSADEQFPEEFQELDQFLQLINRSPSRSRIPQRPVMAQQREPSPGPAERSPSPIIEQFQPAMQPPNITQIRPRQNLLVVQPRQEQRQQIPDQPKRFPPQAPVFQQISRPQVPLVPPQAPLIPPKAPLIPQVPLVPPQAPLIRPQIAAQQKQLPPPIVQQAVRQSAPRPVAPVQQQPLPSPNQSLTTIQEENESAFSPPQAQQKQEEEIKIDEQNVLQFRQMMFNFNAGDNPDFSNDIMDQIKALIAFSVRQPTDAGGFFYETFQAIMRQINSIRTQNGILIDNGVLNNARNNAQQRFREAQNRWAAQGNNFQIREATRELIQIINDFTIDLSQEEQKVEEEKKQGDQPMAEFFYNVPEEEKKEEIKQPARGRTRVKEESKGRQRSSDSVISGATRASSAGVQQRNLNNDVYRDVNRIMEMQDSQQALQIIRANLQRFIEHEKNRQLPADRRKVIPPEDLQSYMAPDTKTFRKLFANLIELLPNHGLISQQYMDLGQPKKTQTYTKALITLIDSILNNTQMRF